MQALCKTLHHMLLHVHPCQWSVHVAAQPGPSRSVCCHKNSCLQSKFAHDHKAVKDKQIWRWTWKHSSPRLDCLAEREQRLWQECMRQQNRHHSGPSTWGARESLKKPLQQSHRKLSVFGVNDPLNNGAKSFDTILSEEIWPTATKSQKPADES